MGIGSDLLDKGLVNSQDIDGKLPKIAKTGIAGAEVINQLVAQIEFLEWTEADHLRHSKFVGLRDDKDARSVGKEQGGEAKGW
jgi:ATP-dependent DNA ligase